MKHGHWNGGKRTPEYIAWGNMIQRCNNLNNPRFGDWGARKITVCDRWQGPDGFKHFLADMGPKPDPNLTLERRDNDGNYESANCSWESRGVQNNNQRPHRPILCGPYKQYMFIAMDSQGTMFMSDSQHEFARNHGLNPCHISDCLHGKQKHTGGWQFRKGTWEDRHNLSWLEPCKPVQRMFIAMNFEGTMIAHDNQSKFAKDHGLDQVGISACLRGKLKQHKGWRFAWYEK